MNDSSQLTTMPTEPSIATDFQLLEASIPELDHILAVDNDSKTFLEYAKGLQILPSHRTFFENKIRRLASDVLAIADDIGALIGVLEAHGLTFDQYTLLSKKQFFIAILDEEQGIMQSLSPMERITRLALSKLPDSVNMLNQLVRDKESSEDVFKATMLLIKLSGMDTKAEANMKSSAAHVNITVNHAVRRPGFPEVIDGVVLEHDD